MAHQSCRRPIANGCVVGSQSTIRLIWGKTLWVGASSSGDRGGRARVRQHSGVVVVARRPSPVTRRPRWNTGRGHKAISGL